MWRPLTLTMCPPPQSGAGQQCQTLGHDLNSTIMRIARSWKWTFLLIGGIFYIFSFNSEDISSNLFQQISLTHTNDNDSAAENFVIVRGNDPETSSETSTFSNLTVNKYLEQEMEEFVSENKDRKDIIK